MGVMEARTGNPSSPSIAMGLGTSEEEGADQGSGNKASGHVQPGQASLTLG